MLKISSSVEYGSRIIVNLAGADAKTPLSADKLAESENIPRDYVDQLLMRLRRAGIVESKRGAHGGYLLAKPALEISVGSVMRAVDDGVFEAICEKYSAGDLQCSHSTGCGIRPVWKRLAFLVEDFLDKVSILELRDDESCVETHVAKLFAEAE